MPASCKQVLDSFVDRRLLVTGKLSEAAYDQLREEWSEKIQNAECILADVERFYASLRFEKREKLDELLQEKGDNCPI